MPAVPTNAPAVAGGTRAQQFAWVQYDLANTVYAATLTYLLTPHAKVVLGDLRAFGVVSFASMAVAAMLVPLLGALADQTARAGRYLTVATLACIAALAGVGLDGGSGTLLLACLFVANVTYNAGLLFYNMLLPAVATPGREGRLSGLGTGLGYVGTLAVLAVLLPLDAGPGTRFPLAAAMFLVTAAPCLWLVRDRRPPRSGSQTAAVQRALGDLRATLRSLPSRPALAWFLLGNFCLVDVLNTAIFYFADFTQSVFAGPAADGSLSWLGSTLHGEAGLRTLLLHMGVILNTLALVAGIALGPWSDRAPLAVLRASALALLVALVGGVAFGGTSPLGYTATLLVFGAIGLAGVWTAGRKVVVLLAPPEALGSCFGLYGITVKLSVVGSALYGFLEFHAGPKPAMLAQGVQLLLGLGCLLMVRLPTAAKWR